MTTGAPEARPARPLRADAQRNRLRVLDAARAEFAERGADAAMEDIARRAGVGVGTLYRNFPRRIDLVEALYREDVDTLVQLAATVSSLQPWDALVAWLEGYVRYIGTKRSLLSELRPAFEKHPELATQTRDRTHAALATVLDRAQQAGGARPDVTPADLVQIIGGMALSGFADHGPTDHLLGVVLDGIRLR
jgi:AcrR family transcriptional regulator